MARTKLNAKKGDSTRGIEAKSESKSNRNMGGRDEMGHRNPTPTPFANGQRTTSKRVGKDATSPTTRKGKAEKRAALEDPQNFDADLHRDSKVKFDRDDNTKGSWGNADKSAGRTGRRSHRG